MNSNVSLIVAASENGVIGRAGALPWHLPADLKRFRLLTTGHHVIFGRKTIESIGRLLPKRKIIVVTRNRSYSFPGAIMAGDVAAALQEAVGDDQPFVAGGAEIYRQALPFVKTILLTRIHAVVTGDTFLPPIDFACFQLLESTRFGASNGRPFEYSFLRYERTVP
jgi:dihydrofolate reductase